MLKYKLPKIPDEPKLYFIALYAQRGGDVLIWHTAVAAFNIETAHSEAKHTLQTSDPILHKKGIDIGGWHLQSHIELKATRVDELLTVAHSQRQDIEDEKERQERNELMQTIVDTASRKLLDKYRDLFTLAEVAYLEDEIEKYERAK